jgi:hypothetical protein
MFLAEKTVKNFTSALFVKLGMSRRTQAAAYAARVFDEQPPRGVRKVPGAGTVDRAVGEGVDGHATRSRVRQRLTRRSHGPFDKQTLILTFRSGRDDGPAQMDGRPCHLGIPWGKTGEWSSFRRR